MEKKTIHVTPAKSNNNIKGEGDKLARLVEYLEAIKDDAFTGYIKINYSQGKIGRIEKFEEILRR